MKGIYVNAKGVQTIESTDNAEYYSCTYLS